MRVISIALGISALAAAATALAVLGGGPAKAAPTKTSIALVAYSTPKEAYSRIIDAFGDTKAGGDTSFTQSYSGSTEQAAAIIAGLPADVVALSLEPDVQLLVNKGKVARTWSKGAYHGMVA